LVHQVRKSDALFEVIRGPPPYRHGPSLPDAGRNAAVIGPS
jgi:hypothetical protein